jgi:hypothetical protein
MPVDPIVTRFRGSRGDGSGAGVGPRRFHHASISPGHALTAELVAFSAAEQSLGHLDDVVGLRYRVRLRPTSSLALEVRNG